MRIASASQGFKNEQTGAPVGDAGMNPPRWSHGNLTVWTLVMALSLLAGGCSHEHPHQNDAATIGKEFLPRPPSFLTGPAVVLLTIAAGFSARLVIASPPSSHLRPVSGQLVAREGKFFFEPRQAVGVPSRAGRFSFIWDASTNKGYILSEALQGYAPIASSVRFTNLVIEGSEAAVQKVEGHPVDRLTMVVFGSDGKQSRFEVSRARDLGGLPIRFDLFEAPVPSTITLSQVRLEVVPEKLFLPPDGFTEYPSGDAMMRELATREQAVQRGGQGGQERAGEGGQVPSGRNRHSRGGADPLP